MASADSIKVHILDVGQGSGNFIEIVNGGRTTKTVLIDLGSESASQEAGIPSVAIIASILKGMTKPRIDFVALTHSDSDHINLIERLLAHFVTASTPAPPVGSVVLEIGHIYFGGPREKYLKEKRGGGGNNVLDELERYQVSGETKSLTTNASSYSFSPPKALVTFDDVDFYLVIGNHIKGEDTSTQVDFENRKRRREQGYELNTFSMIFHIEFAGWSYMITGDATGATMHAANDIIKSQSISFNNTALLTIPHHGSETTATNMTTSAKRSRTKNGVAQQGRENLQDFADNVKAKTIHVSAEAVGNFKHPSAYVLSYFWEGSNLAKTGWYDDTTMPGKEHFYNAYFSKKDAFKMGSGSTETDLISVNGWKSFVTKYAVFTNRYYVADNIKDITGKKTALFPAVATGLVDIPAVASGVSPRPMAVAWVYETFKSTTPPAAGRTTLHRVINRPNLAANLVANVEIHPHMELTASDDEDYEIPMLELGDADNAHILPAHNSQPTVRAAATPRRSFKRLRSES